MVSWVEAKFGYNFLRLESKRRKTNMDLYEAYFEEINMFITHFNDKEEKLVRALQTHLGVDPIEH